MNISKKQWFIVVFKWFTWIGFIISIVFKIPTYWIFIFGLFVAWDIFGIVYDFIKNKNKK